MCLNLPLHHALRLKRDADNLFDTAAAKKFKTDPLLRSSPELSQAISIVDSVKKSHGLLIEKALVQAINHLPDWKSDRRVLKTARHKIFKTDCYAWNKKTGDVFVFECKRDYDQVDSRAVPQIDERLAKIEAAFPAYAKANGIKYNSQQAFILSFYPCANSSSKYTVYDQNTIAQLFPPCVVAFLQHYVDYSEAATCPKIGQRFGIDQAEEHERKNPFVTLDKLAAGATFLSFQEESFEFT
jgi:hypothetical protein